MTLGTLRGQIVPLRGKKFLPVGLGAAKGADLGQLHNGFRLMPILKRQEHIGAHQQPELVFGILFPQFSEGVAGVTLSLPLQLQIQHLHRDLETQPVRCNGGHLHPLSAVCSAAGFVLMGRNARRDEQQLIQFQQLCRRLRRRHVAPMDGVEGTAVNADLHIPTPFYLC